MSLKYKYEEDNFIYTSENYTQLLKIIFFVKEI